MSNESCADNPIAHARRRSIASRRIGIGRACKCGVAKPFALIAAPKAVTCIECYRRERGYSMYDKHHPAGRANHRLTIPIPANDHADLSEAQRSWPKTTLENSDRSPLLAAAACIRGLVDIVRYLMDQLLLWIAQFLEMLDAFLRSQFGPKWWTKKEFLEFMKRSNDYESR